MPIYEYRCEACGETTESLQRMDEPPLTLCLECGGSLTKLISAPAFQFKGSGWYVTDYARKGERGEAGEKGEKGEKKDAEAASSAADGKKSAGDGERSGSDASSSPAKTEKKTGTGRSTSA